MNRTSAILITAAILTLFAVILARTRHTTAPATPPPVPGTKVTGGGIVLETGFSGSHVLQASSGDVFFDISLAASRAGAVRVRRLPLNIGLVIDRSGSMAGQKLGHAREAATRLVSRLQSGDRIAIVTYGSDVTVLVPSTVISDESRQHILRAVSSIVDRGGTYLSGGLAQGRQEVLRHDRKGFVNRVILISDGQANEGITSPEQLSTLARETLSRGVNVTTMGVGLDFNEEVMTAMAEHGGGHYYFIQNSSAMARFFAEELDTMTAVVAKAATLELQLEPGVELLEIFGYAYRQEGRKVLVQLPDLFSGQHRKLIAKLRVPTGREGKVAVGTVTLAYEDAGNGRRETLSSTAEVVVTTDSARVRKSQDPEVLARAEKVQAAATINRAMKAYAEGDVARSQTLLRTQIRHTRQANARLKNKDLDALTGLMDRQISEAQTAAPSSTAGRALIKRSKYRAYKLAK